MKKKIKKAFTLVELLVVIAILAILATVSIVGYNSFTKKAKVSNDTVLVKQMNDILFANKQTDDANPTMSKALEDVFDGGYDLTKLTPTTSGYSIVWDSKNDQMVLLDDSSTKEPVYPEASKVSDKKDLFILTRSEKEFNETKEFAHYLSESFEKTKIETSTGIDTGRNENVKNVSYKNSSKQDAIIRTNSGTLTVDASSDNVYHYGLADKVVIESVAPSSYHENGYVTSYLEVKDGHVVLEKNSSVSILAVNGSTVSVEQKANSELFKVVPVGNYEVKNVNVIDKTVISETKVDTDTLEKMKYGGGTGDNATPYELHTASHLAAFAKDVNNGSFDGMYVYAKLCENVDISGMGWEPIGNAEHPFVGSFDGQENTISGLTNKGYSPATSLWGTTANSKNSGTAYGFFGVVGVRNGDGKANEISLKNINFNNVNINTDVANMLGILLGADIYAAKIGNNRVNEQFAGNITIEKINTNGVVTCTKGASVGGIVGRTETLGKLLIKDCTNNASMNLSNNDNSHMKAGGILGYAEKTGEIEFNNCNSNGSITLDAYAPYYIGGIISNQGSSKIPTFTNSGVSSKITIVEKMNDLNPASVALVYGARIGNEKPTAQKNVDAVNTENASCTVNGKEITNKYC